MKPVIYTVGHSTHPIGYFAELLITHHVNCLVDVRSVAASRFNPQYNKKALQEFLAKYQVTYLHFGGEFGARRTEPELLDENGRVDFEKVRQSEKFRSGMQRLKNGIAKGYTIALMCAEAEPLECHRFGMITPALVEADFEVLHILKNKHIETNAGLEARMLYRFQKKVKRKGRMLRGTEKAQLQLAYRDVNREEGVCGNC